MQLQLAGPGAVRLEPCRPAGSLRDLLAVRACGICPSDRKAFRTQPSGMTLPRVLGHEVAGVLACDLAQAGLTEGAPVVLWPAVACGRCRFCLSGRENLCPEIRLFGYHLDGGYSAQLGVPSALFDRLACLPVPEGLGMAEASLAEPLGCLVHGLAKIGRPPESLLVLGAGLMGRLAIRLARTLWPQTEILVADPDPVRLAATRTEAAAHHGQPADGVLIAASAAPALDLALEVLAPGGTVVLFSGFPARQCRVSLDHNRLHRREQLLVGAYGCTPQEMREALRLIATGAVAVADLVTRVLPLSGAAAELARPQGADDFKTVIVNNN